MNDNETIQTVTKYDRLRGGLVGGLFTKPSTVRNVAFLNGKAETFLVETCRDEERGGDFIFVECVDENQIVTRMALPPKVADAIARQREALTKRRRSAAARRRAAAMTPEEKEVLRKRLAKARKK